MPRNIAKPLDATDRLRQNAVFAFLRDNKADVYLKYRKRDGSISHSTGPVAFFGGAVGMDTGSVTIRDRVKGERTINMHRVIEVTNA